MTSVPAVEAPASEDVRAQLFRYAQDMEELMQHHHRLQRHHQMVLQSIGREIPTADLLPFLLCEATPLHLVSDTHGHILHSSTDLQGLLQPYLGRLNGRLIKDCLVAADSNVVSGIAAQLSLENAKAGGVLCRLRFQSQDDAEAPCVMHALCMQMRQGGETEVHWFLHPVKDGDTPLDVLSALMRNVTSDHGLLLTDPYGTIQLVNAHFEAICGYSAKELVGNNPRMLSSGRHSGSFYQDFWMEILERGSWSGTIFNRRKGGQIFLEWQAVRMIENVDGQVLAYLSAVTDLTQVDNPNSQLSRLAYQDPLTSLANRRLLMETFHNTLAVCKKDRTELSVLFMDLDHFKPINDELGHEVGDRVLCEVATRLRQTLQPGDFLARVGGDEFVVLLAGTERARQAQSVALDLQTAVRSPIQVAHHTVAVGASIGCSRFPQDSADMVMLLNQADNAMYAAKRFQMHFTFFDAGLNQLSSTNLEFDVWHALERGQLHLMYQPQLRAHGQRHLRGCEVLVRWHHPERGEIDAQTFVPMAEKNGAIVGIGKWVIQQACQQLGMWLRHGLKDFTLSVNISLRQLRDPGFAISIQQSLLENGVPPAHLELEFSEADTLLLRPEDLRHIKVLRDMGVGMAIDDFGTSFSGLSRLSALKVSGLKINALVIQDLLQSQDAQAISRCLVAIGQALDIEVIAQGVESAPQAHLLSEQGCKVIQGFFAGKPVTASELAQQYSLENA